MRRHVRLFHAHDLFGQHAVFAHHVPEHLLENLIRDRHPVHDDDVPRPLVPELLPEMGADIRDEFRQNRMMLRVVDLRLVTQCRDKHPRRIVCREINPSALDDVRFLRKILQVLLQKRIVRRSTRLLNEFLETTGVCS